MRLNASDSQLQKSNIAKTQCNAPGDRITNGCYDCACMQAQQYRGGGDAAHEVLLFSVGTSAAAAAAAGHAVPPLPSGNLVSGLAAAVLSHSQVGCSCLAGWQLSHLLLPVMDLQVTCEPDACAHNSWRNNYVLHCLLLCAGLGQASNACEGGAHLVKQPRSCAPEASAVGIITGAFPCRCGRCLPSRW